MGHVLNNDQCLLDSRCLTYREIRLTLGWADAHCYFLHRYLGSLNTGFLWPK